MVMGLVDAVGPATSALPQAGTLFSAASLTVAIIGLVAVVRDMGMPSRFAPAVAVLFGLVFGIAAEASAIGSRDWGRGAMFGVIVGLAATGLFGGVKTVFTGGSGPVQTPPDTAPVSTPPSVLGVNLPPGA